MPEISWTRYGPDKENFILTGLGIISPTPGIEKLGKARLAHSTKYIASRLG